MIRLPDVPRMMWGKDQKEWAGSVEEDLHPLPDQDDGKVLAYWYTKTVRETRVTAICERWSIHRNAQLSHSSLEDLLDDLQQAIQLGSVAPLYDESDGSYVTGFRPYSMQGDPPQLLIFCPRIAAQLGWMRDNASVHEYWSPEGILMAQTVWWRDGLPQAMDGDEQSSEGQFVLLTDEGCKQFEDQFGPIELSNSATRRIVAARGDGECVEFHASS